MHLRNIKLILVITIVLMFIGCNRLRSNNSIELWGSFFLKGDKLQVLINGKPVFDRILKKDYKFTDALETKLFSYHFRTDTSRFLIIINDRDTTFTIENKKIKAVVIGKDIYGGFMIDYTFSDGSKTFLIE